MSRYLLFALFFIVSTTFMGTAMVAVLTMQQFSGWQPLVSAAAAGLLASLPVTWILAKKLSASVR